MLFAIKASRLFTPGAGFPVQTPGYPGFAPNWNSAPIPSIPHWIGKSEPASAVTELLKI